MEVPENVVPHQEKPKLLTRVSLVDEFAGLNQLEKKLASFKKMTPKNSRNPNRPPLRQASVESKQQETSRQIVLHYERSEEFRMQVRKYVTKNEHFRITLPKNISWDDLVFILDLLEASQELRKELLVKLAGIAEWAIKHCSTHQSGKLMYAKKIVCSPLDDGSFTDCALSNIVLKMDYSKIDPSVFKDEFADELARKLGIPKDNIQIQQIQAGSVELVLLLAGVIGIMLLGWGGVHLFCEKVKLEINPGREGQSYVEYQKEKVPLDSKKDTNVSNSAGVCPTLPEPGAGAREINEKVVQEAQNSDPHETQPPGTLTIGETAHLEHVGAPDVSPVVDGHERTKSSCVIV